MFVFHKVYDILQPNFMNFTKFMMFFSTVVMKFLNSKVRLKGERSITAQAIRLAGAIRLNFSTFLQDSNQPIW
jgi:hypothetical protein